MAARHIAVSVAILCACAASLEAHTTSSSMGSFAASLSSVHRGSTSRTCSPEICLEAAPSFGVNGVWGRSLHEASTEPSLMRLRGGGLLSASITYVALDMRALLTFEALSIWRCLGGNESPSLSRAGFSQALAAQGHHDSRGLSQNHTLLPFMGQGRPGSLC